MDAVKIDEFYKARVEYFRRRRLLQEAVYMLEEAKAKASDALYDTIDNGFSIEQLCKVDDEWNKSGFSSSLVKNFLDDIDAKYFAGIDAGLKKNLEVTNIEIDSFTKNNYCSSDNDRVMSPVKISVIDIKTKRKFMFIIPIKNKYYNVDILNWDSLTTGLYVVYASPPQINVQRIICRAFDSSLVAMQLNKFLRGELDDDLMTENLVLNDGNKRYSVVYKYHAYPTDSTEYSNFHIIGDYSMTSYSVEDDYISPDINSCIEALGRVSKSSLDAISSIADDTCRYNDVKDVES